MKKILLFGGAFDPPHLGHSLLVEKALELVNPEELWVMPAYGSTFGKLLTPWYHRVEMVRIGLGESEKVKISLFEIEHQLSGSTIETITLLQKVYPDYAFSFLIGSDQLGSFTRWEQWQQLLTLMQFYVYPRDGFPLEPMYPGMQVLTSPEISGVSSTEVRERIKAHQLIDDLVTPEVAEYIENKRLFI